MSSINSRNVRKPNKRKPVFGPAKQKSNTKSIISPMYTQPRVGFEVYHSKGVSIVPDVYVTKIAYKGRFAINPTSGALAYHQFSANSIYDPDVSATGTFPEGYAILSSMYNNYRVISVNVEFQIGCTGTTSATTMFEAAIALATTATPYNTMEAASASPFSRWRICSGTSNPIQRLSYTMPIYKLFGVEPSAILDDQRYSGTLGSVGTGGNPGYNGIINILTKPVDGSTTLSLFAYVKITYMVECYGRQTIATMG